MKCRHVLAAGALMASVVATPASAGEFTDLEISKVAGSVGAMAARMDACLPQLLGGTVQGGPQVEAYVTRAVVEPFLAYNARCEKRPSHQIDLLRQIVTETRSEGLLGQCDWNGGMPDADKRMINGWAVRTETCDARKYILSASTR